MFYWLITYLRDPFMLAYQSQAKKDGFWSDKKPYKKEEGEDRQVKEGEAGDGDQVVEMDAMEEETPRRQAELRPRVVTFQEPGDAHGKEYIRPQFSISRLIARYLKIVNPHSTYHNLKLGLTQKWHCTHPPSSHKLNVSIISAATGLILTKL